MSATPPADNPVDDYRLRGNHEFSGGRYDEALSLYTAALEQPGVTSQQRVLLLCNRSATYFQQEQYEFAEEDAKEAWEVVSEKKHVKAAFRLAKSQLMLEKFEAAKHVIGDAQKRLDQEEIQEQETADKKSIENQRKALDDLWQQVLTAAYEKKKVQGHKETTIKFIERPVSIREFEKGSELGHGNFSDICIVTHKETKEQFALKSITKKQAADLAKRQHPNVYNEIQMERRVLLERLTMEHPHVVRMYHSFSDYNSLYYLMDLHTECGDLWSQLQWTVEEDIGSGQTSMHKYMVGCHRSQAVVWMSQLVDAVEHMHRHGIVHRDLKTENVLLNNRNQVVVIDFGTAKDLIKTDLNGPEFVGTPDFMSPEAVSGTSGMQEAKDAVAKGEIGAIHTADLWALGAILYIMQTGMTPFWCPGQYLAFLRIKRGNLTRPYGIVDDDTWDLVSKLMKHEPSERLGADAFELEFSNKEKKTGRRSISERSGGYDMVRKHPYFSRLHTGDQSPGKVLKADNCYVIPSLCDLCVRAVAMSTLHDAQIVELCDAHPPGDGSRHDLLKLDPRERTMVMHVLDRRKLLNDPRLYARFFSDSYGSRLARIRPATRDFVGLTQMNDDQAKPHKAKMHDPYGTPIAIDDIRIVQINNPLFDKAMNESCTDETRTQWIQLLKSCIRTINRQRPRLVIAAGFIDDRCRKLLSRISESIPVVAHDGSAFFTLWILGVQCIVLASNLGLKGSSIDPSSEQLEWIREQMEQCRMTKHPMFGFVDADPRDLSPLVLKRLARGRMLALYGHNHDGATGSFKQNLSYTANELVVIEGNGDEMSIRSDDSEEDMEKDSFTTEVECTLQNSLRWIRIGEEPDDWDNELNLIEA